MIRRPPNVTKEPVSPSTRYSLIAGAVVLIVAAAVVNISHTRTNAERLGQDHLAVLVIGVLPDFALPMSVARLRYYRRCPWGWAGVILSVTLIAWSALSGAQHGAEGQAMSLVCLAFAIVAAGQAHLPSAAPVGVLIAHVEALAEDAHRGARQTAGEALERVSRALGEARTMGARVADLEAALVAERAAHEAAVESARQAARDQSPDRTAKRTAGAQNVPARGTAQGGDLQRRAAAREAFEASVRSECALSNAALARLIYGLGEADQPDPKQIRAASARASEWKRGVLAEERTAVSE